MSFINQLFIFSSCLVVICPYIVTLSLANQNVILESNQCQDFDLTNTIRNIFSCGIRSHPVSNKEIQSSQASNQINGGSVSSNEDKSTLLKSRGDYENHHFHDRVEERNAQMSYFFNGRLPDFVNEWMTEDKNQLEDSDIVRTYLYNIETFHHKKTLAQVGLAGLYAQIHGCEYSYLFMHRYESYHDLKQAAGPHVDQEMCLKQLSDLKARVGYEIRKKYDSKDIKLHQLLDTYGRNPAGLLMGNIFWEGLFRECLRLKIDYSYENWSKSHDTRYCIVQIRPKSWPNYIDNEVVAIRFGACLPRSCDSLNYKNKYELILDLFNFNARTIDLDVAKVSGLYCLPDEESPMRSIWHSKASTLALVVVTCWIGLLLFATIKSRGSDRSSNKPEVVSLGLRNCSLEFKSSGKSSVADNIEANNNQETRIQIYKSLSITNNLSLLFDAKATSSLIQTGAQLRDKAAASGRKESLERGETENDPMDNRDRSLSRDSEDKIVNLCAIEGVKVVAMWYVIFGHVIMCITSGLIDGRQIANSRVFSFANMIPAFAVNTFFGITGILTCYLVLKQNQSYSFITQPSKWIAFIVYRYLRIMPMYLLAVAYSKLIAKYTNSGPIWDYGTSSLSQRRICEQESWLWTLLFGANFKRPLDHCIPGGWYLANDFQFFIVTPIFLSLLKKNPKWGKQFLGLCIVVCYIGGMICIFRSEIKDFTPIALFEPHGFKTFITNLYYNYTRPYYRIPAYLFGLYIGFVMYNFEQAKLNFYESKRKLDANVNNNKQNNGIQAELGPEPDWPESFKKYCVPVCSVLVFLCCITPFIAACLPFNKTGARIMVSFIAPSFHLAFSMVICLYILASATTERDNLLTRILSAPQWKPFARLSLCAILVNIEVIIFIIQGRKHLHPLTTHYLLSVSLLATVATYLVATIVCILFEAPLRAALNHLLKFAIIRIKSDHQRKSSDQTIIQPRQTDTL